MKKIQDIKRKLYLTKLNILFNKAVQNGRITKFDEEIYIKMSNTIISCLPVSFYIKYANHLFGTGTCYDRSLYMFIALDDAVLVRGDNKELEYKYGKESGGHGWVEIGDYVYDPSLLMKFEKNIYYQLYGCSNVKKIDKKAYLEEHKEFVSMHVTNNLNELRPNGKRRLELGILIIQMKSLSKMLNDEQFTKDLNDYLNLVEYDEKQISEERYKFIQYLLSNEESMSIISGNKK